MHSETLRQARILIVDDELANVRLLELILEREGYAHVSATTDPRTVVPLFQGQELPDLLLLDLHMPHCTGYEIMQALGRLGKPASHLPIIVLTADSTTEAKRRALTSGATDFVCKPFDNLEVLLRIRNALELHFLYNELVTPGQVLGQRVRPHQTSVAQPEAVTALGPIEPLHVLVVDDQPMLCEILTEYLLRDGHQVATSLSGEEALEKFQTAAFDLIITDKAMPGMNGHQLAAAVRKLREETLIILLTGFAESGVSSSLDPEIDAVVGKPVALETLREAIAHAFALHPHPPSASPVRYIPAAGFLRTGPDPAEVFEVIKAHLAQLAPQPEDARPKPIAP